MISKERKTGNMEQENEKEIKIVRADSQHPEMELFCADCSYHDDDKGCTREEPGCMNDVWA